MSKWMVKTDIDIYADSKTQVLNSIHVGFQSE